MAYSPDRFAGTDAPLPGDGAALVLRALAGLFGRLSSVLRPCVARGRAVQTARTGRKCAHKDEKAPYEPPVLTDAEQAVLDACSSAIASLAGPAPAAYAHDSFVRALETGDLRAFKIRLLFLKARDALKGLPVHRDFAAGLEDAISRSEEMAGCVPDGSPRRLSRAEQERKRRILAKIEEEKRIQPELPLEWPQEANRPEVPEDREDQEDRKDRQDEGAENESREGLQDRREEQKEGTPPARQDGLDRPMRDSSQYDIINTTEDNGTSTEDDSGSKSYQQVINKRGQGPLDGLKKDSEFQYIEKKSTCYVHFHQEKSEKSGSSGEIIDTKDFTVKEAGDFCKFTVKKMGKPKGASPDPIRKAREYETVEQILDDIESGAIVRYESADEIKDDLMAGKLTPVEALMFAAALDRYCETDLTEDEETDEDLEREFNACDQMDPEEDFDDREDGDDGDDGEDDDDGYLDEEDGRGFGRSGTSFSYNPRGFYGVGGCSASGDWDRDDEW